MGDLKRPEIRRLDKEREERLEAIYHKRDENVDFSHVAIGKSGYAFFRIFEEKFDLYYNFKARSDDVWICTYPRSGTNWTAEMTWLLMNDMDFETASSKPLGARVPFLEYPLLMYDSMKKASNELKEKFKKLIFWSEDLELLPSPRLMETHIPLELLPTVLEKKSKIIYVARNPKDVAVSFYHFHKNFISFKQETTFETFYDTFQNAMGPYWSHVKEAWETRNEPNMLFLFYEEMIQDLPSVTKRISAFLDKSYNDEDMQKLLDHVNFANFQKNKMINYTFDQGSGKGLYMDNNKSSPLVRSGKKEAWKDWFTPEMNESANKWIAENLNDTDLRFPFIDIFA